MRNKIKKNKVTHFNTHINNKHCFDFSSVSTGGAIVGPDFLYFVHSEKNTYCVKKKKVKNMITYDRNEYQQQKISI